MSTQFNLGPGTLHYEDPDSRAAQAAQRAERVDALAEKLFVEWVGQAEGFSYPLDDGLQRKVGDVAGLARECAAIFVDGAPT